MMLQNASEGSWLRKQISFDNDRSYPEKTWGHLGTKSQI